MNMLRSIREKKGLTLGQLAARASISARVLSEYEEGRQPIPLPHAKLIAKALWVQIEDLLPPAGSVAQPPAAQAPLSRSVATPAPTQPEPRNVPAQSNAGHQVQGAPPPQPQQPRPAYVPARPPQDVQRVPNREASPAFGQNQAQAPHPGPGVQRPGRYNDGGGPGQAARPGGPGARRGGDSRPARVPRTLAPPPKPITEGQVEEILRLASRLEAEQGQLEERIGKPVQELTRPEAKEWIKRFRAMADEVAPTGRVRFGQWPGSREDREATYLGQHRDAGSTFTFKLFNSEQFDGVIADFTPYTITIKVDGGHEMVLRKLAIAYYRQTTAAAEPAAEPASKGRTRRAKEPTPAPQPAGSDIESDRVAGPNTPEADNMDEDRGI
jgi:transcriptional regulator with XRE-family HTH domain/sRNA-binding regulator protein Hfq